MRRWWRATEGIRSFMFLLVLLLVIVAFMAFAA